jgi:magnesium-transporting ATPase (P-type)
MLHDVCVSKTGTLTEGKLKVTKFQVCDAEQIYDCSEGINFFESKPDA